MKFNYLIRSTPLLSTFLLLLILCVSNQKEYTKLRILIWNTPSLTLGTYLSISTGTGFLFSYFMTTKIAKINQSRQKDSLKFRSDNQFEEIDENIDMSNNSFYDNTLIERDIKDPSPTINASFRVIGRKDHKNSNFIDNNIQYKESIELNDQFEEQQENNFSTIQSNSNDWDDESFASW